MDNNQKEVAIVEIKTRERYNLAKYTWWGIVFTFNLWLLQGSINDITELVKYLLYILLLLTIAFFIALKLMGDKTKYFAPYIAKLEKKIDPNRASSNLTTTGDTQHHDK